MLLNVPRASVCYTYSMSTHSSVRPCTCNLTCPCNNIPDVVEAVVQLVMHLVADYGPRVVLWWQKNTGLLVRVWVRRVGLGVGLRPQQGRGGERGRRLLLLLDTERRRGGEARPRGLEGGRRCSGGRGARRRRGRGGAGHGRREGHLTVALFLAALEP